MSGNLAWSEVFLRLGLAFLAGALMGFNRAERGHVVGLRTVLLVCLAAAVSMVQVQLMLGWRGKTGDSYVVLDLMRLPLGILSGMGFIGAGAILRRGSVIVGVTTAATLWFATVIGLCFGGGQLGLGSVSTGLALFVLWGLHYLESALPQAQKGRLFLAGMGAELEEAAIRARLDTCRSRLIACAMTEDKKTGMRTFDCTVTWKAAPRSSRTPEFVGVFSGWSAVDRLEWSPESA